MEMAGINETSAWMDTHVDVRRMRHFTVSSHPQTLATLS